MKKLLAKLSFFTFLSIILASFNPVITNAQDSIFDALEAATETVSEAAESATEALQEAAENTDKQLQIDQVFNDMPDCVVLPPLDIDPKNVTKKNFPDLSYTRITIDEPLRPENRGSTEKGDDIVSRVCYTNTFSWIDSEGKEHRTFKESTDCSEAAEDIYILSLDDTNRFHDNNVYFNCKEIQVLLTKGGASAIEAYIAIIYQWGASVAGIIAVLVIILNGIRISASGGDSQAIENAKTKILQSIGGLVLLFLSGLILYTINPTFFVR